MQISLDRARIDRYAALVMAAHAVGFAVLIGGAVRLFRDSLAGPALVLMLLGLVLAWFAWSGLYLVTWLRARRIEVPMELQPTGIVARSQFGELVVPWEAMASAAVERTWSGSRLRIRLVDALDPRRDGVVVAWLNPQMLRVVEREGLRYSLRVLDIGVDQLREAFATHSGGRVRIS